MKQSSQDKKTSTANCIVRQWELAQQYERALGSEVTNFPGSRAYIPLGSLSSRQLRYLKRRIASLVRLGNPASRRRYIQPRAPAQALPPGPVLGQARRYHVLFLPRLPTSTWILGVSTTTPNLSVYVDLRIVQANLSLPQRSNQLPAFPAILQIKYLISAEL